MDDDGEAFLNGEYFSIFPLLSVYHSMTAINNYNTELLAKFFFLVFLLSGLIQIEFGCRVVY